MRDLAQRRRAARSPQRHTEPARQERSLGHNDHMLAREAEAADVPVDLLKAICWHASGWRQFQPDGTALVTPTRNGSLYGCMQLSDVWHPDAFPGARADAESSIRYAAALMRWLSEQFDGDWNRATVAFFGHDGRAERAARRVRRYEREQPWLDRLPTPAGDHDAGQTRPATARERSLTG
jgi:hypothetical protein